MKNRFMMRKWNELYVAWRLLFAGSGFKRRRTDIWKIWNVTKAILKEHRSARYQYLLLTGKLNEHLNQIDQESRKQMEMLMGQMVERQGVTEELKVQDQMKWVRLMNNIKASAEEIVLKNMVYV